MGMMKLEKSSIIGIWDEKICSKLEKKIFELYSFILFENFSVQIFSKDSEISFPKIKFFESFEKKNSSCKKSDHKKCS